MCLYVAAPYRQNAFGGTPTAAGIIGRSGSAMMRLIDAEHLIHDVSIHLLSLPVDDLGTSSHRVLDERRKQ